MGSVVRACLMSVVLAVLLQIVVAEEASSSLRGMQWPASKPSQVNDSSSAIEANKSCSWPSKCVRDNYVYFEFTAYILKSTLIWNHQITSGQPWGGIYLSNEDAEGGLLIKAGRHKSGDVASTFNSGLVSSNIWTLDATSSDPPALSKPSELNFMIDTTLSFTVLGSPVFCGPGFRIGQGSSGGSNMWSLGAQFCSREPGPDGTANGGLTCKCPNGGPVVSFTGNGHDAYTFSLWKANGRSWNPHTTMHSNRVVFINEKDVLSRSGTGRAKFTMTEFAVTTGQPFDGVDQYGKEPEGLMVYSGRKSGDNALKAFLAGIRVDSKGNLMGLDQGHNSVPLDLNFYVGGTLTLTFNGTAVSCGPDFRLGQEGYGRFTNQWWIAAPFCRRTSRHHLSCKCEGHVVNFRILFEDVPQFRWSINASAAQF